MSKQRGAATDDTFSVIAITVILVILTFVGMSF